MLRFWLIVSVIVLSAVAAFADDTPLKPAEGMTAETYTVPVDSYTQPTKPEITPSVPETLLAPVMTPKPDLKPVIAPIENKIISELEPSIGVRVEGERLVDATVTKTERGALFVRAEPIFNHLNDVYEYDPQTSALVVTRSQDGVRMELFTDTGIVKSDGQAIGKLRVFGEVSENGISLTPNAISVLAGTNTKQDKATGELIFELDARLKVATGYQLYVNQVPLSNVEPAPKSVGPVLLLPLLPIAEELGHFVQVAPDYSNVTVRRAQDSALFELDLTTGLVKRGGRPIGVSKDVTYIDQTNLLLPVSAMETLTGTHITVAAGSDRVDIDLDDRLTGSVKPGARVDEEAREEPFIVEELRFHTGIDTHNDVELDFRVQKFNGQLRYSVPDLPTSAEELRPNWLSVEYRHLDGAYGSIGDYSADRRELDGVGIRRIQGASVAKVIGDGEEAGLWSLAIGRPASGSEQISDDQSRVTFSGVAAGLRYADQEGWEAGLSYKKDGLTDDQMTVLSAISGKLGRVPGKKLAWDSAVDLGYFKGQAREKSVDVRVNGNARYELSENVDVDVFISYTGAEFLRSELEREELEEDIINAELGEDASESIISEKVPDIRVSGQDQFDIGGSVQLSPRKDVGILANPGISGFVRYSESGVNVGEQAGSNVVSYGVTGSSGIADTGANVTFDYSEYSQKFTATPESNNSGNALNIRAYKDFEHAKVRAQYSRSQTDGEARNERLSVATSLQSHTFEGHKGISLTAAPSLNLNWTPDATSLRGGLIANAHSGELFGPKTKLQASLGVLQSFGNEGEDEMDTFFTASVARRLKINENLALSLTYRNDLQGDQRLGIQLDGLYNFNERRKYSSTDEGRGVLNGRAFLDENRDGIWQDTEPGIGGTIIRVTGAGRKLALRSDGQGYYTIQNIKEGIHNVAIDNRSLPIGYALSDKTQLRATVRDGHITSVDLPIVQRGQVRGFAFVDSDGNGAYDRGETRLEGARLRLLGVDDLDAEFEAFSSSFGQYAFDDLPAGRYMLEILSTNAPDTLAGEPFEITLEPENDLMVRRNIVALPTGRSEMVQSTKARRPYTPGRTR